MTSYRTITPVVVDDIRRPFDAGLDELRTRMLRDLELFLSYSLSGKSDGCQMRLVKGDGSERPRAGGVGSRNVA